MKTCLIEKKLVDNIGSPFRLEEVCKAFGWDKAVVDTWTGRPDGHKDCGIVTIEGVEYYKDTYFFPTIDRQYNPITETWTIKSK